MQTTPIKDARTGRGILQPQSPSHLNQSLHQKAPFYHVQQPSSTSFTKYRTASFSGCDEIFPGSSSSSSSGNAGALCAADSGYSSCLDSWMASSASSSLSTSSSVCGDHSPVHPASAATSSALHRRSLGSHQRYSLNSSSSGGSTSLLAPIQEGLEMQTSPMVLGQSRHSQPQQPQHSQLTQMTPNTRNAQQRIADFHISTPKQPTTSLKRLLSDDAELMSSEHGHPSVTKSRRLTAHGGLQSHLSTPKKVRQPLRTPSSAAYASNASTCSAPSSSSSFASASSFMDKILQLQNDDDDGIVDDVDDAADDDDDDEDAENSAPPALSSLSSHEPMPSSSSMDVSPIVAKRTKQAHGSRAAGSVQFKRLASDHQLQSSTPIAASLCARTQFFHTERRQAAAPSTAAAASSEQAAAVSTLLYGRLMMRKTQSFSPSKLAQQRLQHPAQWRPTVELLRECSPHRDHAWSPSKRERQSSPLHSTTRKLFDFRSRSPPLKQARSPQRVVNPARKLLDFNAATFDSLVGPPSAEKRTAKAPTTATVQQLHDSEASTADDFVSPPTTGDAAGPGREPETPPLPPQSPQKVQKRRPSLVAAGEAANPARKLLDFNADTFESLVSVAPPVVNTAEAPPTSKATLRRQAAVSDLNASGDTMHLDGSSSNSSSHIPQTPERRVNYSIRTAHDLRLDTSISIDSPFAATLRTPKKMQRSFSLHTTTTTATNTAAPGSASRREQNSILYANLPCTPPKSAQRQTRAGRPLLKRRSDTQLAPRSPVKRRLYDENRAPKVPPAPVPAPQTPQKAKPPPMRQPTKPQQRHQQQPDAAPVAVKPKTRPAMARRCYAGMDRLDVFGRLEHDVPAIDRILAQLSTEDLGHVRQVSKRWQRIVESNPQAQARVVRMERRYEVAKENGGQAAAAGVGGASALLHSAATTDHDRQQLLAGAVLLKKRKPFGRRNPVAPGEPTAAGLAGSADSIHAADAVAISPHSRAFRDNQTLVKTLKKTQRLMKCPRCHHCSVIDRCHAPTTRRVHIKPSTFATASMRTSSSHITARPYFQQHVALPFAARPSMDWTSEDDDDNESLPLATPPSPSLSSSSSSSSTMSDPAVVSAPVEFAQCTSLQCEFRFCISCLCEFDATGSGHSYGPDGHCKRAELRIDGSRPLVKSHSSGSAAGQTKRSRKNLRRLGSLE